MSRKVCLVTGFVPIARHPRSAETYDRLYKEGLSQVKAPCSVVFSDALESTWLHKFAESHSPVYAESGDNPKKNTLAYHCVNHEKTRWLARASWRTDADVFVWVDYGIFHMPTVTKEAISNFLERVSLSNATEIEVPGCWENQWPVMPNFPCWRFCGSVLVCPREHVERLDEAVRRTASRHIMETYRAEWEVNTWARVELQGELPFRWYKANHDVSMFENYGKKEKA